MERKGLGGQMISNHGTTSIVFFQILPCSLLVAEALLTQPSSSSFSVSLFFCFSSQVLFHFSSNSRKGKFNRNYYNFPGCRLKKVRNHYFFPSMMGKNWKKVINRRSSKKRHRPVTIHLPCEIPILSKTTPKMIGFTNFKMDNFDL